MELNKNKSVRAFAFATVFVMAVIMLYGYLYSANDMMPLMDYWLGFDVFAYKIENGLFTASDYFPIPHAIHWSAGGLPIAAFFYKVYDCNNMAYILWGGLLLLGSVILLLYWSYRFVDSGLLILDLLLATTFVLAQTNLNQWEILDLYCSAAFYVRIFLFILLLLLVDNWLQDRTEDNTKLLNKGICLGVACIAVQIGVGAAYYPGLVCAILVITILNVLIKREPIIIAKTRIVMLLLMLGGSAFLILTTASSQGLSDGTDAGKEYFSGLLVMLSSTVIPQAVFSGDFTIYYIEGAAILVITIMSIIMFFRYHLYEKTWLPLACLIYGGATAILIIYGRSDSYGFITLTSSRYVVETTIGLLGILMIQALSLCQFIRSGKKPQLLGVLICSITILFITRSIISADTFEIDMGEDRQQYDQQLIAIALDIDSATDQELALFQAPANDVRKGIRAMEKYELCLWDEDNDYYPPKNE